MNSINNNYDCESDNMEYEDHLSMCRELYDQDPTYNNSFGFEYYTKYIATNNDYSDYATRIINARQCSECATSQSDNNNLIRIKTGVYYCINCYNIKFPDGNDRTDYNKLFNELNENPHSTEDNHRTEDEIYRRFIRDIASGKFNSQEDIIIMAKKIKKEIIDDRMCECRWYA